MNDFIKEAIDRANDAFCKRAGVTGTYHNDFTPQFAEILIDDICKEISNYTDGKAAAAVLRRKYSVGIFKRGDRVVANYTAGFHKGAHGVIEFVEPSYQRVWVLRDGSTTPVYYSPDELDYEAYV